MNKLIEKIHQNFYIFFHIDRLIMKQWPHFYLTCQRKISANQLKQFKQIQLKRPFWLVKVTILIIVQYLGSHFVYFQNNQLINNPFFIGIRLYPFNYRLYLAAAICFWLLLAFLQLSFALSTRLIDYQFLWILHLDKINFRKHFLHQSHWARFKNFKNILLIITNIIISSIMVLTIITLIYLIIQQSVLDISIVWTIYWFLINVTMSVFGPICKY